jgi:hypothetical protein
MYIGKESFKLYQGVNAPDGTLLLPSAIRGAALYQNTIWIHRLWHSGWVDIRPGMSVYVDYIYEGSRAYFVVNSERIDYGTYPPTGLGIEYLATCYKDSKGQWAGVELFKLTQHSTKLPK